MKVTMHPAVSLDGFISRSDGDSSSWVNEADEERYEKAVRQAGCVITGRTTFDQFREDFDAYEGVTIFVCSNENRQDTDNIKYVRGRAEEIINNIEENYTFDELIVCGGGEVNGMLAAAMLVDELVVSVQPVALGEGTPLFGGHKPALNLKLVSTNEDIKGVTQNFYRVLK